MHTSETKPNHHIIELCFRVFLLITPIVVSSFIFEQMENAKETPVFEIQEITLIEDIPEKIEEEEPEPVIEEPLDEVEIEQVEMEETITDEAPVGDDNLGLDGDGEAGLDSFGLKAKKGGRSLLDGINGGGKKRHYDYYAGQIQRSILNLLDFNNEIRRQDYIINVEIWVKPNGKIKRLSLQNSTGDLNIDRIIESIFKQPNISLTPPPNGLPQPIRIKIRSSGVG